MARTRTRSDCESSFSLPQRLADLQRLADGAGRSPHGCVSSPAARCTSLFRLTPEEALAGVTRHAARALGLADRGVLAAGLRADFVLWDVDHPAQLGYAFGANPQRQTVFKGLIR